MINNIFQKKAKAGTHEGKRFGVIETSIFKYLTPMMCGIFTIVVLLVGFNISTLLPYFNTNVSLNGLIVGLALFGLIGAFHNNYAIYKTAKFLKLVEDVTKSDHVKDEDINALHKRMVKHAPLVDTQNMHNVIENIRTFGHLNFTDTDARLIKSKMGYRIRLRKSSVGFLAGILVMLGLLGTFLGLLATIDAVGNVMNSMSNIGGDGAVDEDQMAGFIGSLAKPLQGMGLAFSSSLFGLSGSLLIGFFNHLCGSAQDSFIENVGRWVDERIPRYDPTKDPKSKDNKPASSDDLKTWLAGFVYLSVKTNKQMGTLSYSLIEAMKKAGRTEELLTRLVEHQEEISAQTEAVNAALINIGNEIGETNANTSDLLMQSGRTLNHFHDQSIEYMKSIHESIVPIKGTIEGAISAVSDRLDGHFEAFGQDLTDMSIVLATAEKNNSDNWLNAEKNNVDNWSSLHSGIQSLSEHTQAAHQSTLTSLNSIHSVLSAQKDSSEDGHILAQVTNRGLENIATKLDDFHQDNEKILMTVSKRVASTRNMGLAEDKLEKIMLEMNQTMAKMEAINEDKLSEILDFDVSFAPHDDKLDNADE